MNADFSTNQPRYRDILDDIQRQKMALLKKASTEDLTELVFNTDAYYKNPSAFPADVPMEDMRDALEVLAQRRTAPPSTVERIIALLKSGLPLNSSIGYREMDKMIEDITYIKQCAAWTLGYIGGLPVRKVLEKVKEDSLSPELQEAAQQALDTATN